LSLAWLDGSQLDIVLAVAGAMLLGGLVGLEREMGDKPAGLRTHMLVAGAAALLVSLDRLITARFADEFGATGVFRSDPIGVIQAVVTGVAFLGAGTIIRERSGERVGGLTTAASLLFTAALGIAAGLELWVVAVGGTILALLTLHVLPYVEHRLLRSKEPPPD
jgi:putative Mg2+ transporter-C (MgtC) family protein